jgi:nitroreductase
MNPVIEQLLAHRSIRRFTDAPVSDELFEQIIQAAQCAATSSFFQACTVIRVRNPDTRAALATVAGGQAYVENAPIFCVFCADLKRADLCCSMHEKTMMGGFTEHFIIATVDAALMAQNAVVAAQSAGLGICYIGALRNDPQTVCDLLKLPDNVYPVFGLCLGYPDQQTECKPRLTSQVVLKEDYYDDQADRELIEQYDAEMSAYYQSRSSNQKISGWSEQLSVLTTKEARPHMKAFLEKRGFLQR